MLLIGFFRGYTWWRRIHNFRWKPAWFATDKSRNSRRLGSIFSGCFGLVQFPQCLGLGSVVGYDRCVRGGNQRFGCVRFGRHWFDGYEVSNNILSIVFLVEQIAWKMSRYRWWCVVWGVANIFLCKFGFALSAENSQEPDIRAILLFYFGAILFAREPRQNNPKQWNANRTTSNGMQFSPSRIRVNWLHWRLPSHQRRTIVPGVWSLEQ